MSAAEVLAARLVAEQFPGWAHLPLVPVEPGGTDHDVVRLGDDLAVRLPRHEGAAAQGAKERAWLPRLAPQLPLPVPVPMGSGRPTADFPRPWSVVRWLPGDLVRPEALAPSAPAALAGFLQALRQADPTGGPAPGEHNFERGVPLAERDPAVREALALLSGELDTAAAARAWERATDAAAWQSPGVWVHGDLHAANVLAADGELTAVLDFGGLGVGDPAVDVMAAWTVLPPAARPVFRRALGVDDATWRRGAGWALSMGLIALPHYRARDPAFARTARGWVDAVLADGVLVDGVLVDGVLVDGVLIDGV